MAAVTQSVLLDDEDDDRSFVCISAANMFNHRLRRGHTHGSVAHAGKAFAHVRSKHVLPIYQCSMAISFDCVCIGFLDVPWPPAPRESVFSSSDGFSTDKWFKSIINSQS